MDDLGKKVEPPKPEPPPEWTPVAGKPGFWIAPDGKLRYVPVLS